MSSIRVPVNLVFGAAGAGKTTLVNRLLERRPRGERWAVLVNDFGQARIAADENVVLREVHGCACCTSQVALRTALVSVLRAGNIHRLVIEAFSGAEPEALLSILREPGIAPAVDVLEPITVSGRFDLASLDL